MGNFSNKLTTRMRKKQAANRRAFPMEATQEFIWTWNTRRMERNRKIDWYLNCIRISYLKQLRTLEHFVLERKGSERVVRSCISKATNSID